MYIDKYNYTYVCGPSRTHHRYIVIATRQPHVPHSTSACSLCKTFGHHWVASLQEGKQNLL